MLQNHMTFFTEAELPRLNSRLNKENRTIAFLRGDSKKLGIVKIQPKHYELAKNPLQLNKYWEVEQINGYIPQNDEGNAMITELSTGSEVQLAENIARHEAYKIMWPMYKSYKATTFMKRIKIATTPGTFADNLRDFKVMSYDPKNATLVLPDGTTKKLTQYIKGVGLKYIGDGGTLVGRSFLKDFNIAHGLKDDNIEFKTAIYQKKGDNLVMIKHNSFLVNKDMEIYENYGKPGQRLIVKVENYIIKNSYGELIDMLGTPDEFKVMDGYVNEQVINVKGKSAVSPFYTEETSTKATHGMQYYNYFADEDVIYDLWNPEDGEIAMSVQKRMAKLFNMGIDAVKTSAQKKADFLEEILANDEDGFLPTILEHAKLGADNHPVISNGLDKLTQTRIISPALNLKGRPGAKLIIRPNTYYNLKVKEISIPRHALGPAINRILASFEGMTKKDLSIEMINDWLKVNEQKVLLYRTPIASIKGAGVYKIHSVHDMKNLILMNENDVYYDLEADNDGDKVQIEYLNGKTLDKMETYIENQPYQRSDLSKFIEPNYESDFNMNSNKGMNKLIGALLSGQNGLGEIAKAASIYGILNTWFINMTINGRKVILTPKDYTLTWPTYFDGNSEWKGTLPEMLSILLQASADNAEYMLLGKWSYNRDNLYRMMFKYEDTMQNISTEDVKIITAMIPTLKIPANLRMGSDYVNGRYFATQTFKASKQYNEFIQDRLGYLQAIIEKNQFIDSKLNDMEYVMDLHPYEIIAAAPDAMRSIKDFQNGIATTTAFPLGIDRTMHKNAHEQAMRIMTNPIKVSEYLNDALNRDGLSKLSAKEKSEYVKEEYNKAAKYVLGMKNDFLILINSKGDINFSTMDRDEAAVKFKETYHKKFNNLSNVARMHATIRFMDGFTTFSNAYETKRGKVLKAIPAASKSKKEYSNLDWRVLQNYYKLYNDSIKNKLDYDNSLTQSNIKYSYKETVNKICKGF